MSLSNLIHTFDKLLKGTVETLVKPENKATLTSILTYHVVSGKMSAADLMKAIADGGGKATLKTVAGGTLTASQKGKKIEITERRHGLVHTIDSVLLPQ